MPGYTCSNGMWLKGIHASRPGKQARVYVPCLTKPTAAIPFVLVHVLLKPAMHGPIIDTVTSHSSAGQVAANALRFLAPHLKRLP